MRWSGALWLEADRMGFLLPAMTREKLDSQRDVVKNERRERVDNVPYGRADETVREALYPAGHPYRHSVIGSMADLSAAGPGDVGGVLPHLLCAGQRDPVRRRRLRPGAGPKAGSRSTSARCPAGPRSPRPKPNVRCSRPRSTSG